jgi:hypothetical protein
MPTAGSGIRLPGLPNLFTPTVAKRCALKTTGVTRVSRKKKVRALRFAHSLSHPRFDLLLNQLSKEFTCEKPSIQQLTGTTLLWRRWQAAF